MIRWFVVFLCGCSSVGQFECGGKALTTVPNSAVCDGVVDCWGGQDERDDDCATETFFCEESTESEVILADQVCDGVEDCSGGIDESDCD